MINPYIIDAIRTHYGRYSGGLTTERADALGAIVIAHRFGASGAGLVATALNQLESFERRYVLCSMRIGVGQGSALIVERG